VLTAVWYFIPFSLFLYWLFDMTGLASCWVSCSRSSYCLPTVLWSLFSILCTPVNWKFALKAQWVLPGPVAGCRTVRCWWLSGLCGEGMCSPGHVAHDLLGDALAPGRSSMWPQHPAMTLTDDLLLLLVASISRSLEGKTVPGPFLLLTMEPLIVNP
jgi:hypothetical protein